MLEDPASKLLGLLLTTACIAGCFPEGGATDLAPAPRLDRRRAIVRERATREFPAGLILKPARAANLDRDFALDLAPLLLLEKTAKGAPISFEFGKLEESGRRIEVADTPRVYFHESTAILRGAEHRRLHYVWFFRPRKSSASGKLWRRREVRLTLDQAGFPWVQEVLGDSTGLISLYVGSDLEEASKAAHGPPLPGRELAVEPSVESAPAVVVPRILSQGPVPMGPWVYLDREHFDVTTLLCRCMPSQVEGSIATSEYELESLPDALPAEISGLAPLAAEFQEALDDASSPDWLDRALRLPD